MRALLVHVRPLRELLTVLTDGRNAATAASGQPHRADDLTQLALRLSLREPEAMRSLCGERDSNLRQVENRLGVSVLARGEDLHLTGPAAAVRQAAACLQALFAEAERGEVIDPLLVDAHLDGLLASAAAPLGAAQRAVAPLAPRSQTLASDAGPSWRPGRAWLADAPPEPPLHTLGARPVATRRDEPRQNVGDRAKPATQSLLHAAVQRGRHLHRGDDDGLDGLRQVSAWTPGQHRYLQAMADHDVVLALGPAGTGKTWLAVAAALAALQRREVRRIVLTRPAVEAGEHLGFLPGDLQEKVSPYLRPLYDALKDLIDADKVARLLERGAIEAAPLAFMRGRTLASAFVILDEAQNTTPEQMLMLLTRLGDHTKMVVCGDPLQTDLRHGQQSGLAHALRVLRGVPGIGIVELDRGDVVRHPLVGRILEAYDRDREQGPR